MSHFDELSGHVMEQNPHLGFMGYSNDNFLPFLESFSGLLPVESPKPSMNSSPTIFAEERRKGEKKRKAEAASETNSVSSSATPSETKKKNRRSNSKEVENPKEVVHVRARRGQAIDSHSLAERPPIFVETRSTKNCSISKQATA